MEKELVTLENGKVYAIMDEIQKDSIKYLYLVNIEDTKDYAIRKEEGDLLVGLEDEKEFRKAMDLFLQKQLAFGTKRLRVVNTFYNYKNRRNRNG